MELSHQLTNAGVNVWRNISRIIGCHSIHFDYQCNFCTDNKSDMEKIGLTGWPSRSPGDNYNCKSSEIK